MVGEVPGWPGADVLDPVENPRPVSLSCEPLQEGRQFPAIISQEDRGTAIVEIGAEPQRYVEILDLDIEIPDQRRTGPGLT